MRILFSLTYYSPYVSGLTEYVKNLAEALAGEGQQVKVICLRHKRELAEREKINGVETARVRPWIKISKGWLSGEWIIKAWKEVKKCDVVIINLPQVEGVITAVAAKLLSKKIVAIYICRVETKNKLAAKILEWSSEAVLYLADKAVTLTRDYAEAVQEVGRYTDKLEYIYPMTAKLGRDRKWEEGAKREIGQGNLVVGFAGRMAGEKGVEYLLEGFSEVKKKLRGKAKLVMAGPEEAAGEEGYKKHIRRLAERLGSGVVWLGQVPEGKMGSFYRLLDMLVLPSINSTEALGMVQIEAMLCGVPVVATDLPGVRVPIKETGMGIIVPIRDSQAIGRAMVEVVKTQKRLRFLRKTAENKFNNLKVLQRWMNILTTFEQRLDSGTRKAGK